MPLTGHFSTTINTVDVKTVLGANLDFSENYIQALAGQLDISIGDATTSALALFENSKFKAALNGETNAANQIESSFHYYHGRKYGMAKTPLFEFEGAEGFVEIDRSSLGQILKEKKRQKHTLEEMLDEMDSGRVWESFPKELQTALRAAVNPRADKGYYDLKLRVERTYPHLIPKDRNETKAARIARLFGYLDAMDKGKDWATFSPNERKCMKEAADPKIARRFLPAFRDRMMADYSSLLPAGMEKKSNDRISRLTKILDEMDNGRTWKSFTLRERGSIGNAANPKMKTYLPSIAERLQQGYPNLIPVNKSLKRSSRLSALMSQLDELDTGRDWLSFSAEQRATIQYAINPKRPQFAPSVYERVKRDYPQLLPKEKSLISENRIIDLRKCMDEIESGKEWLNFTTRQRKLILAAINPNSEQFLTELRKRVETDIPHLLEFTKERRSAARLNELSKILDEMDRGKKWNSLTHIEKRKLRASVKATSKRLLKEVRARMERDYPILMISIDRGNPVGRE